MKITEAMLVNHKANTGQLRVEQARIEPIAFRTLTSSRTTSTMPFGTTTTRAGASQATSKDAAMTGLSSSQPSSMLSTDESWLSGTDGMQGFLRIIVFHLSLALLLLL